jgi:transposase
MATRRILAIIEKRTFFSLSEGNETVRELLEDLNNQPFKKLPGTRRSLYEKVDKPALKPLPLTPYEYRDIKAARVNIDYHIEFDEHLYSAPYQLARKKVEVHATANTIEIFYKGRRVASHARSYSKNKHTTLPEHMPRAHRKYLEWTPSRIVSWASKAGPSAGQLVQTIMEKRKYPEQAYRSCLGIIRLGKTFGQERLESACKRALAIGAHSYKSVKSILQNGLDRRPLPSAETVVQLKIVHPNIRGPQYYSQEEKELDHANSPNTGEPESTQVDGHDQSPAEADGNARDGQS